MTAAEELADLRQRLADYAQELRERKATYHSVEAGLAVGQIAGEVEAMLPRGGTIDVTVRLVTAEPVFAFGERGE